MAIAFDAATYSVGFATNRSFSHTTSGSERMLFVAVVVDGADITGVTYNGDAMTAVETGSARIRLYALVNPASGANTVLVSHSLAVSQVMAVSYTGVDQTTPYDGVQASATGDGSPSLTVSSATGDLVVGMSGYVDSTGNPVQTVGADQTSRGSYAGPSDGVYIVVSDEPGAASVTHSYTRSGGFYYSQRIVAVNVIAAGAAGPTIDTQPVADTVLINGDPARRNGVFTVAATTSGGSLSYQWQEDDGGGFANITDGGIYSGATTATLTIVPTDKTQDGYDYRCNVTDDNGTTASSGAAMPVYTGPVLSKSSGTTNGSGVDTVDIVSDYPNADGEFTVITATAGGVTKQVAMHYEAP